MAVGQNPIPLVNIKWMFNHLTAGMSQNTHPRWVVGSASMYHTPHWVCSRRGLAARASDQQQLGDLAHQRIAGDAAEGIGSPASPEMDWT